MTSSRIPSIAFLFGSGISIPAKMPSVKDITRIIVSGKNIQRHSNGSYAFNVGPDLYPEYIEKIVAFLSWLDDQIDQKGLVGIPRSPNYEDLYFFTFQIHDYHFGILEQESDKTIIEGILANFPITILQQEPITDLGKLTEETMHYMKDIVYKLLTDLPDRLDHLNCVIDACQDLQFSNTYLFTLNHDILLESYLSQNKITFTDGFNGLPNQFRVWNPELFKSSDFRLKLFKLHGSINWYRFRNYENQDEFYGIPHELDERMTKSPEGKTLFAIEGRPILLSGTNNKLLEYRTGIYKDFHFYFGQSLNQIEKSSYLTVFKISPTEQS